LPQALPARALVWTTGRVRHKDAAYITVRVRLTVAVLAVGVVESVTLK
jgi:hypothetical protein